MTEQYIWTEEDKDKLLNDIAEFFPYFTIKKGASAYGAIRCADRVTILIKLTYNGELYLFDKIRFRAACYASLLAQVINYITADKTLKPYHVIESAKWQAAKADRLEKKLDAIYTMMSCAPGGSEYIEAEKRFKNY